MAAPATVDEYIAGSLPDVAARLERMREIIGRMTQAIVRLRA